MVILEPVPALIYKVRIQDLSFEIEISNVLNLEQPIELDELLANSFGPCHVVLKPLFQALLDGTRQSLEVSSLFQVGSQKERQPGRISQGEHLPPLLFTGLAKDALVWRRRGLKA